MKNNSVERGAPLIVGVGASAGGLEAFQEFLRAAGDLKDISVVFVQHLEQGSDELLVELLSMATECPVVKVAGRKKAKAGTIYVCSPWTLLDVKNGTIRVAASENDNRPIAPIDYFLHSLAEDQGERGVGVILSGKGTDGTVGLKAISDAGGMTFAQLPESAKYDSMPRSAVTTGVADHVLAPREIADELTRYAAHLTKHRISQRRGTAVEATTVLNQEAGGAITGKLDPPVVTNADSGEHMLQIMQQIVLDEFAPKSVIVGKDGKILCASADMHKYLTVGTGSFQNNIIKMARPGLRVGLRATLLEAQSKRRRIVRDDLSVSIEGKLQRIMLTVQPMPKVGEDGELFMVVFHDCGLPLVRDEKAFDAADRAFTASVPDGIHDADAIIAHLENLFQSTQIATLFLDPNEHLIQFTPAACEVYNLISTDVGRPLGDITHKAIAMPPIPSLTDLTLANNFLEQEIQTRSGRWFLRRALPCFHDGQAAGVILTFIDITERKRALIRLATMHQVTRILARDPSIEAIFPEVLRAISDTLNATYCAIWLVDSEAQVLQCTESLFEQNTPGIKHFAEQSQYVVFERGSGLPGRVWQSRETHWIENLAADGDFPRQKLAAEAGLLSGVALPIVIGSMVYGVIEIFTSARLERDTALQDMLQSVGNEIGQFIIRKELDEKLRHEEARKSAILEVALDAIVTMDMEGRIVDFNQAAERAFGFTRAEVQGQLLSETIIPHEYREAHTIGLARYLKTGTASVLGRRLELTAMRKDGSVVPVELAISATTARDGSPFFTAHLRDITEHKQFVHSIVDRDNRITALLNSTAEGIYGIDPDGRCTFANASSARLLGFESPDELIGRHMHELIHHTLPDGRPYPVEDCRIYRAFRLGESIHADDEYYWRADGTSFGVEYWSYPQIQDGQVVGCVVSFLDITERKQWLSDLADRESHLRRVIDNTLGFIGVLDSQGILLEANETALIAGGVDRTEVIGRPFWECYWWSHDAHVVNDLKAAIATALTGEVVRYDVEVRMAGDSRLAIDFMLAPVKDAEGQVTHLIPSGVDISERKWVEREVQQRVAQLDLALESGRMGIWEWDIPVDHVTWSSQMYEMFGYTTESFESTKAGFMEVVFPEDRPQLESMIKSAFAGSCSSHQSEFRVVRGDNGGIVWTHCRGTIRRDEEGSPLSIISVAVDITERKQRELSLAFLSELQSRLAGFSTADAIVAETSRQVAEYLQVSHFLLIEMDDEATQAHVVSDHCRDESSSLLGTYDMAVFATESERRQLVAGFPMIICDAASPERPAVQAKNFEQLNVRAVLNAPCKRNKKLTFMLSAVKSTAYEWKDHEVQLMRELATILRLKLERSRAESALRESEGRFRDLADNISQFAWMADPEGSVFWFNHQWFEYTGTTLEEMKDWGWKSVQHPDHINRVVSRWQESLESGEVWEDTFPMRSKDGDYRWFLSRAQPIRDDNGRIQRWFGTNTDITETKQAEDALRAKEEQMRLGIEVAKFAIAQIDYLTNTVHLSREAASLYGIGNQEMDVARQRMHETLHPDDREELRKSIDHCLTALGNDEISLEHRIVLPDGTIRWLDIRKRIVFDRSVQPPRPIRGILAARDITDQKDWEIEIATSRERLTMAMTSARMGSYEWEPESDRVLWDEQHLAITGLTRTEMTGAEFLSLVHPDDVEANQTAMERTIRGECDYDTEFRIIRPDGQVRWLAARGKIVPATAENPLRFVGMNWDITEQKQIQEVIRLGEARLQRIIAGTTVGIAFASESGDVTRANDASLAMLGITQEKFQKTGFNWNSVVRPSDTIKAKSLIQQLKQSGVMPPIELQLLRADNTLVPVMVSAMSVDPNSDEHVVFLVDLSEQKRYEQSLHLARKQAEAANESKSEFVANMSHEIRTPMTAVLGYADLLMADEDDPQKLQYLQTIKRNGSFLLEIINDILDLSKIEAGKMEILKERFPVQTVVEDVRSMMDARATQKSLDFVVEYNSRIPAEIESDPKRLRQILVNLIGNAIKFTESGSVTLEVRFEETDGGAIRFDVTDTGIGITPEQQRRLFQPFSQGDASVTRAFGGTGLGLTISRRLAQFLGGDIVVRTQPGIGSTFSFTIAVGDISGVLHIQPSTSIEREGQGKIADYHLPCHVLVVDDRRDVRFLSRRLLTKAGATVTEAEDGMEAVEFVKGMKESKTQFDLVLLDMQMPRMDGYQTASLLRQMGFLKPIIALTADAMHGDMNRCLESGCDDYLSKPIDSNALLEMVRNHTRDKADGFG